MALDDKYDDIKKLIDAGKEKGYLTYDQVNDLIPHDVHSPEDLDDLLTTIGTQGIDVLEGPKLPSATLDKKFEEDEAGEDVELDLTPGALEKTNDPVRMYLREMGTVPLLTREGEVEIAKRIERGQLRVLKALSRSPIVINELLALGEDLKKSVRSIKEVVTFDEEEAKKLLEQPYEGSGDPALDFVMGHPATAEIQKRWPRGWFTDEKPCPKGCGYKGIAYASYAHHIYGDW